MGDPEKYSRRRREQIKEERDRGHGDEPWEVFDRADPMHLRVQWPWGCVPSTMSGLVVASVVALLLAVLIKVL